MLLTDKAEFSAVLAGCFESIYEKPVTPAMLDAWFMALSPYPLDEIKAAIGRHVVNPDSGQFAPKPADIVRLIDGNGDGRALRAWAKVEKSIRTVGGYRSVVFDDELIHACIADMGGWISLCETTMDELQFRSAEFAKRYRACLLSPPAQYPSRLSGRAEISNSAKGHPIENPALIGDTEKAMRVMLSGTDKQKTESDPGPIGLANASKFLMVAKNFAEAESGDVREVAA